MDKNKEIISLNTNGIVANPDNTFNSPLKTARHTFPIYLQNGQRKPKLRRAFIRILLIDMWEHDIVTEDGSSFHLYHEQELVAAFKYGKQELKKCIVSFQIYEDGEAFAVARLWKEDKRDKQNDC